MLIQICYYVCNIEVFNNLVYLYVKLNIINKKTNNNKLLDNFQQLYYNIGSTI